MLGRKILYPRDFGAITSGSSNVNAIGVAYNSLRIQGYAYGSKGLNEGMTKNPDDCIFPNVNTETSFGTEIKTKCRVPIMTGALGSTFIAAKYWDSFCIGGALCGIPVVIGENVVGVDRESKIGKGKAKKGKIKSAPEICSTIQIINSTTQEFVQVFIQPHFFFKEFWLIDWTLIRLK